MCAERAQPHGEEGENRSQREKKSVHRVGHYTRLSAATLPFRNAATYNAPCRGS
jgi:hypothetical protein